MVLLNPFDKSYVIKEAVWSPHPNFMIYNTDPLGRKSSPTICSTRELLPEL